VNITNPRKASMDEMRVVAIADWVLFFNGGWDFGFQASRRGA
jgi:hypothetical protein